MSERIITLPDRDEMLERLLAVNDSSHMEEHFYPKLLRHAGEEKHPLGVVLMLWLAINDYVEEMPAIAREAAIMTMTAFTPRFIDALITDSAANAEAKEHFQAALTEATGR